jgi:MFS family permease
VARWFERRRGLALGLAVSGATIVSWVGPATAQWIIDQHDWRQAVRAFGLFTLCVAAPILAFFTVSNPESVGQRPDGDEEQPESIVAFASMQGTGASPAALATSEIVRDARLWLAAIGFGLIFTSPIVLVVLIVRYGEFLGFTGQEATTFFGAMVPFSLAGKILLGRLADVAPLRPTVLMIVLVNVLVWILLYLEPAYPLFLATGAIYGIGIGGAAPIQGVLMGRLFGRVNFGRATGIGGLAAIPLLALANIGSQSLLGATGSYRTTFGVQIAMLLIGGLMLAAIRVPPSPAEQATGRSA